MVGYYGEGVPTSVDLENSNSQNKYTVNREPQSGVTLSKLCLFLMALGALLLILLAIGLTILLYPKCTHAVAPQAFTQKTTKATAVRLPKSLEPQHYTLKLIPDMEQNFSTDGLVSILLNVRDETKKISFNTYDIDIEEDSVQVKLLNGTTSLDVVEQTYDNVSQIYTLHLNESLKKGKQYELEIKFVSYLNDNMQGFYRSHYIDPRTNTTRWMASTQFSPTDARRAFPCFDEPAFKSKFTISVARRNDSGSISNMPKLTTKEVENVPNFVWDHYYETLPMSTYLVAFVASDFQAYRYNSSGKLFTVWSRVKTVDQTRVAIDLSPKILQYFEDYFTIKFPLPKIDLVGVPDFGFSAMENWGLITFKETVLLFDEKTGTIDDRRSLATILAHEIAHQWFGNLVTPAWWDDLWLKEGFASYLNYLAVEQTLPDWQILDEFLVDELYAAFAIDSLKSSNPIHFEVVNTEDIRQMFGAISYSKGASIIRMLNHVLGETSFKNGLIKYLNDYKYKNANHDDLWKAMAPEKAEELPGTVKQIMDTWTTQAGFPVLTATKNLTTNEVYVTQKRFFLSREYEDKSLWWVPISSTSDVSPNFTDTQPKFWLKNDREIAFLIDSNKWWLLNIQQTGYFVVNYDEHNWRQLVDHVTLFPPITRVQLISDSMLLARANLLDYDIPLRMLTNLGVKDDLVAYAPQEAAFDQVSFLHNMLVLSPIYKQFEDFIFRIFYRSFSKYDFNDKPTDDYRTQRTRKLIVNWACKKSESRCTNDARVLFREWLQNPSPKVVPPNVQKVVFCTAIREGGDSEWKLAYSRYLVSTSIYEKNIILDSLGCSQIPWILSRYLGLILSNSSEIRKQDCDRVFRSVVTNPVGHSIAFDYLRENWDALNDHFGPAFSIVSKMVSELPIYMNTQHQLKELESFKNENINNLGTSEQAFNRAIEIVKCNVEWKKHSYHSIEKWLEEHSHHYGE